MIVTIQINELKMEINDPTLVKAYYSRYGLGAAEKQVIEIYTNEKIFMEFVEGLYKVTREILKK